MRYDMNLDLSAKIANEYELIDLTF